MIGKTALLFLFLSAASAETVVDAALGYSINLPAGWAQFKSKPAQHYFRDGAKAHPSQISIVRHEINAADYPTPKSWTEAQFVAYKLSVETSVFPFGAISYFDSSANAVLGDLWAPAAFSVLYPGDGDPTYCEYIRYCAIGNAGYEIYAIGDSTDMTKNVDYYAGIIATIRISPTAGLADPGLWRRRYDGGASPLAIYDLSGRSIRSAGPLNGVRTTAAQMLLSHPAR